MPPLPLFNFAGKVFGASCVFALPQVCLRVSLSHRLLFVTWRISSCPFWTPLDRAHSYFEITAHTLSLALLRPFRRNKFESTTNTHKEREKSFFWPSVYNASFGTHTQGRMCPGKWGHVRVLFAGTRKLLPSAVTLYYITRYSVSQKVLLLPLFRLASDGQKMHCPESTGLENGSRKRREERPWKWEIDLHKLRVCMAQEVLSIGSLIKQIKFIVLFWEGDLQSSFEVKKGSLILHYMAFHCPAEMRLDFLACDICRSL